LKRNWLALAASALMFATVASSAFSPWWKVEMGSGFVTVNADPFFTSFNVLGVSYVVPIIFALNVGSAALFVASGIALVVYAIKPEKGYSKHLLSFGWKRPLHMVIGFLIALVSLLYAAPVVVNAMARDFAIPIPIAPLTGSSIMWLPRGLLNIPAQVAITVTSTFTYSFFLGVATAALSIAARAYHRRTLSANKFISVNP
jgi:hypothetical protein